MHWSPFTCLPREFQRVVALDEPKAVGASELVRGARMHGSDGADPDGVACHPHAATLRLTAQLLEAQGAGDTVVLRGSDRAPLWPRGFIGSITHTDRFAAVAVMPESTARSVGIDAECELGVDQQILVRRYCVVEGEMDVLVRAAPSLSETQLLTLCFSAKEAAFKCLYPLVKRYFDFSCVRIVAIDESANLLSAKVLDAAIAQCADTAVLQGSSQFAEGHVFTAFRLPPQ